MEQNYKLLAADMDGTLLNDESQISRRTLQALHRAIASGMLFVPSSGRPMAAMEKTAALFTEDLPFITFNGALALTSKSKKVIYSQPMDQVHTREVLGIALQRKISAALWSEDTLYATDEGERVKSYQRISGKPINIIDPSVDTLNFKTIKVIWLDCAENIDVYKHEMQRYFEGKLNVHPSQPIFLEFVDKKASKAAALEKIGELYGIKREQMIAVGDGFNDLSMLEYAGLAVAMENAPEQIKKSCDYVTSSNNDDGVAALLDKFIFKEGN